MSIVFERMTSLDIPQVYELFKRLLQEGAEVSFAEIKDEKELHKWLKNPYYYMYVGKLQDKVVAVFRCIRGEAEKNHSGFLTIAVEPTQRGNHIAKEFTMYCLGELKGAGIKLARAYIYSDNKASINTILACGFTVSGCVFQHHYNKSKGKYVDDIIFHKLL
ncbi:GNAT family N-acetyltransferase [Alkaliphilus pronyensis]|uniref:GNAT family N-acetyltransferase n=1 Tax=Alkaliphilus pronyensis TaxID=1482732 RepID=A0A6I0EY38_9FIRM|nr:GNAT family N-acetyltransferase [Alkaliphilus pronyensis]KAB3534370.1 GNAT family N-acetyltransferase [Alkaliphilus pronyensis]